jgi:hypothetical protein
VVVIVAEFRPSVTIDSPTRKRTGFEDFRPFFFGVLR